jgi:hypothetical protein
MSFEDREQPMLSVACPRLRAHAAAVGGRILATVPGALGTAVHGGRHGLVVCGCSLAAERPGSPLPAPAAVWSYDCLIRLSAERSGSLSALGVTIRGRSGVLPLIVLDPADLPSTQAAIDRVQNLIDSDHEASRYADTAWVPVFAIAGAVR